MKHLNTIILSLAFMASTAAKADNYTYLTITQTAAESSYELRDIERITFSDTDMLLHLSGDNVQRLPLSQLQSMFFSTTATAIVTADQSQSAISIEQGMLHLKVAQGERITIYGINGNELLTADHDTTIDLHQLKQDVYIARMGSHTQKFIAK